MIHYEAILQRDNQVDPAFDALNGFSGSFKPGVYCAEILILSIYLFAISKCRLISARGSSGCVEADLTIGFRWPDAQNREDERSYVV